MHNQEVNSGLLKGPPAYVAATPWPPGWAMLAGALIVALGIGATGLLGSLMGAGGPPAGGVPEGATGGGGRWWDQDVAALALLGAWQVVVVALTLLASTGRGGRVKDVLALRAPAGGATVFLRALLLLAGLQVLLGIVQHTLIEHDMFADLRPFVRLVGGREWPLALAVIGLGAPLAEELLFRGFLLSALARSRLGFWGAALVTSALWTALHAGYSAVGIAEVFLIGLFLSWLLWRTGSLLVPILCHALYNSFIVTVLRFVPLPA